MLKKIFILLSFIIIINTNCSKKVSIFDFINPQAALSQELPTLSEYLNSTNNNQLLLKKKEIIQELEIFLTKVKLVKSLEITEHKKDLTIAILCIGLYLFLEKLLDSTVILQNY